MMKKRMISLLLALFMFLPAMGCAEEQDQEEETDAGQIETQNDASGETEPETEPSILDTLPEANFDGKTFNTITEPESWWLFQWLTVEDITGEVLNDSVFNRNEAFHAQYNAELTCDYTFDRVNRSRTSIAAGDDTYQFLMLSSKETMTLVAEKLVRNLNNIDTLDFDNPAWDARAQASNSIANKLFIAYSYLSLTKAECNWVYFFNKNLLEVLQLESPYELVLEGKWTLDKAAEMIEAAAHDTNGDGEMTAGDRFGLSTHPSNYYALLVSGNAPSVVKDQDDMPVIMLEDEYANTVGAKIGELFGGWKNTIEEYRCEEFMAGNALFSSQELACVRFQREMEDDFGILPCPKYDEAQENYLTTVFPAVVFGASIPLAAEDDPEEVGTALQALAILSEHWLVPAYYEATITGKGLRDEDSVPMLDIILETNYFDLGAVFDTVGLQSLVQTTLKENAPLASRYKRRKTLSTRELEGIVEAVLENEY